MRLHCIQSLTAVMVLLATTCGSLQAEEKPAHHVGFKKLDFSYESRSGEKRTREFFFWYPTTKPDGRYDYRGQIGKAVLDGDVVSGKLPLILFSHGFLGSGDQTIFLTESLARQGYLVAAPTHADGLREAVRKKIEMPNFADVKTWDDAKHFDRKEDVAALTDHLLRLDGDKSSFLCGRVDAEKIGAAGHSLGGYTVLGLLGARKAWSDDRLRAGIAYSPYALPYVKGDALTGIRRPLMLQGGTLDFGITPFLDPVYRKLNCPKTLLVLKNETHFGWTNLIALGKTTTDVCESGNAKWMVDYTVAFFDHHLLGEPAAELLSAENKELESFRCEK